MTPLEQFKSILDTTYTNEDGYEYKVLLDIGGLTDEQIDELAAKLPTGQIPDEIRELLKFASGFGFDPMDDVIFSDVGQFGFEQFFPCPVQLMVDGAGNFWLLDVHKDGKWGEVFYVCHDPAVIVKNSDNLVQFIQHIDDLGKKGKASHIETIRETTVIEVWEGEDGGLIAKSTALLSNDETLKSFATTLPDNFVIADLRNKPLKSGFAWGKFGPNVDNARRHENELLWGVEKVEKKKGFFSKLFGKDDSSSRYQK